MKCNVIIFVEDKHCGPFTSFSFFSPRLFQSGKKHLCSFQNIFAITDSKLLHREYLANTSTTTVCDFVKPNLHIALLTNRVCHGSHMQAFTVVNVVAHISFTNGPGLVNICSKFFTNTMVLTFCCSTWRPLFYDAVVCELPVPGCLCPQKASWKGEWKTL